MSLSNILGFDSQDFQSVIDKIENEVLDKVDPKYLLLKLYKIVQYIDQQVALKPELSESKTKKEEKMNVPETSQVELTGATQAEPAQEAREARAAEAAEARGTW